MSDNPIVDIEKTLALREMETINETERWLLECMVGSAILERRIGYDGWTAPNLPADMVPHLDRLVEIGLAERQADDPKWVRPTEHGESLLAQIEASEATTQ